MLTDQCEHFNRRMNVCGKNERYDLDEKCNE